MLLHSVNITSVDPPTFQYLHNMPYSSFTLNRVITVHLEQESCFRTRGKFRMGSCESRRMSWKQNKI